MRFRYWLLLSEASQQETQALKILGGDDNVLRQLKSISPEPKFLPVLALFHKDQPDLGQLKKDWDDYRRLLDAKKTQPLTVQGDKVVAPPSNQPVSYLHWTEKIHSISGDEELVRRRMDIDYSQWKPPIFKNENLEVYETDGPGDCIRYGKGYSFCISQPGNTMWQSYRDTKASTFYFVYDKSRDESDPLHIVVVDITKSGPIITDAKNITGNIAEFGIDATSYLEYLFRKGVPRNIFKNKEHTASEKKEDELLGKNNFSLEWFKELSPDQKSKYIGRGHELTDKQFDYIFDNGMESLVKQYAEIGRKLNDHQMARMLGSKFRSTYLHFRIIADQNAKNIELKEYERMNPEQKKAISPVSKARIAGATGDIEYIKSLKDNGSWASAYHSDMDRVIRSMYGAQMSAIMAAAKYGNLNVLRFMIDEGKKSGGEHFSQNLRTILLDAVGGDQVEAVEMILQELEDNPIKTYVGKPENNAETALSVAALNGSSKVLKSLAEKHWEGLDDDQKSHLFEKTCSVGNEESVKYLSGLLFSNPKWTSHPMPLKSLESGIRQAAVGNHYETVKHLMDTLEKTEMKMTDLLSPIMAVSLSLGGKDEPYNSNPTNKDDIRTLKLLVDRLLTFGHPLTPEVLNGALSNTCRHLTNCNLKASAYLMLKGAKDPDKGPGNIERKVLSQLGFKDDADEAQIKNSLRKAAGIE